MIHDLEIALTVRLHWTPPRPAPHCNDPDDPRFSDSGDGGELEVEVIDSPLPMSLDENLSELFSDGHWLDFWREQLPEEKR